MIPEGVKQAWIWPPGAEPVAVDSGLINQTLGMACRGHLVGVLQRLNTEIFAASVHHDIHAITEHLHRQGVPTPRLVPTSTGSLWHTDEAGGVWRVLTPIGDRTVHKISNPKDALSGGALVARWHRATAGLSHEFAFTRPGAHDTDGHMNSLRMALMTHRGHRLYRKVATLSDQLFDAWSSWSGPTDLPVRIIHGDLKISNLRFTGAEATALIDLDTMAQGTLDIELGDAMRSWCNPASENVTAATFDLGIFEAAMTGYRQEASLSKEEWEGIGPGIERICLELSARFARDALEESYFGWDAAYGGRGEHNLLRARGQASLAASVHQHRAAIDGITSS